MLGRLQAGEPALSSWSLPSAESTVQSLSAWLGAISPLDTKPLQVPCCAPGHCIWLVSVAQHPSLQGRAARCEQGYPLWKWGAPSRHRHCLSCAGSHWRGSTQPACGAVSMLVPSLCAGESCAVWQWLWRCAGLWGLLAISRQLCKPWVAEQGPGAPGSSLCCPS